MTVLSWTDISILRSHLLHRMYSCVTFSGLSKSHMIAGFRIGWMILSGAKERAKVYRRNQDAFFHASLFQCAGAGDSTDCLGGYQSVAEYVKPGGRVYEQRECIYNALKDIRNQRCEAACGILYFPETGCGEI